MSEKTMVPLGSLIARRIDGLVKYCGILNGKEVELAKWEIIWTDVACRKCSAKLGDVAATMPRADLCENCFQKFVEHACEVTPAQLLKERMVGLQ